MNSIDSTLPTVQRRTDLKLLGLALLAGTVGLALFWLTTVWKIRMPWNHGKELVGHPGLSCLALLLLALAGAWVRHRVPARKAWRLLGLAAVLCFTGSAVLSMHGIVFDPLSAALSVVLGGLVAWWSDGRPGQQPEPLPKLGGAELPETSLETLAKPLQEQPFPFEQRSVFILTCCLKDALSLRKRLGPFEFLTLTTEFRRLSTALLVTRRALVLPGSGETMQACFGVPLAGENDGPWAAETVRLLAFALKEYCPTEAAGILQCGFSLLHGEATTGMGETSYEVSGPLLESARMAAEQAPENFIARDATTAAWLPASEPEVTSPPALKKPAPVRKKPTARKTALASDTPPAVKVAKNRAPKKTKASVPKGTKKSSSEEN